MDAYRLNVKLYADGDAEIEQQRLIPIFHRWIQDGVLDETLIDVADYKHVPDGPGVMLIAHEAHYGLDETDGRLGMLYARKRPFAEVSNFGQRLRASFAKALAAARALEQEPTLSGLRFAGDRLAFRIADRLLAPDGDATFAAVEPELRSFLAELYGSAEVRLERETGPRQADLGGGFGVRIEAASRPGVAALLERL